MNDREERLIKIVLHGLRGPVAVGGITYNSEMAALGEILNDQEVAAVLTYVRNSWGNQAPEVRSETVARLRKKYQQRELLWNAEALERTREVRGRRGTGVSTPLNWTLMLVVVVVANVLVLVGLIAIYRATRKS